MNGIYIVDKESFNAFPHLYQWTAIMKYAGKTFRLNVHFERNADSICIFELTDNGWVNIADRLCLEFDRKFDYNPYDNTREVQIYTRKVIEMAMLNFILKVFSKDSCVDESCIKDHIKEILENEHKPKEAKDSRIIKFVYSNMNVDDLDGF